MATRSARKSAPTNVTGDADLALADPPIERPPPAPDLTSPIAVRLVALQDLIPYARNARTHSAEQVAQLAGSMMEFGFTNPVLADATGIVAGHGRVLAARQLTEAGKTIAAPSGQPLPRGYVPVIDCTGWPEAKRRAYVIADNKLALNSGWDVGLLTSELRDLRDEGIDLDGIGFGAQEIAELFASDGPSDPDAGDDDGLRYSGKIDAPAYEPTGENPPIATLADRSRAEALLQEIDAAGDSITAEEREFLRLAAARHVVFDYQRIAERYAQASPAMQQLMEASALVIIDIDDAIARGYVIVSDKLAEIYRRAYGDTPDDEEGGSDGDAA